MILAFLLAAATLPAGSCRAVDGDTLRCGQERIRLVGIDAPEMPGHCARWRRCAPGDPVAARRNLARLIATGPITLTRTGQDHYGRTLALVLVKGTDLSCAQLRGGFAIYKPAWDTGARVARICGR